MVGFGSSLRQARRSGWEGGYLDYETLKLLLSQIEAVYEEERHTERRRLRRRARDYRDDLFLESNSDLAYESAEEDEEPPAPPETTFSLSYSHEVSSSEEEEETGCTDSLAALWDRRRSTPDSAIHKKLSASTSGDDYYPDDTFFVEHPSPVASNQNFKGLEVYSTQGRNAPFATESSGLLPPSTPAPSSSTFYSLTAISGGDSVMTPPSKVGRPEYSVPGSPPTLPQFFHQERLVQRRQRRQERRIRRRRQLALERKVPRYLRLAHARSRAITERFLGLLRAETEKVLLFAQSRLGELADTAGSLRFASLVEHSTSEYPLSDGGLHPSASSSDDEGANGLGSFPWSDSSDEETASRTSQVAGRTTPLTTKRKTTLPPSASKAARRQLDHFAKIRQSRPLFQRNDHILGEDLLFLSAIEEADGYTTVGVELNHVLKFICVNLIAVRKICRKHDRLLMNRMLGGYYHRTRLVDNSHMGDAQTLGGMVARASGDIYEAHPALIGQMNLYKLVGVYDKKIQKLANSRTVQVISSCLALALSEYEVAQSRADALTRLNSSSTLKRGGKAPEKTLLLPVLETRSDESIDGPPSTTSTISLTRLRFAVTSTFALREAARYKLSQYSAYLARSVMSFTGQPVAGEGLDGCSRETLDFIVSYNPDAALLLDSHVLFSGLCNGQWTSRPMSEVMIATLATGTLPDNISSDDMAKSLLSTEKVIVANAISVVPESKRLVLRRLLQGELSSKFAEPHVSSVAALPDIALLLSRTSSLLFMMNYFIAHSTTNVFLKATGASSVHSAAVIGAPNLSAILAAAFHCWLLSGEVVNHRFPDRSIGLLRRLFIVSSIFGVFGNVMHALAVIKDSISLAILGRFVLGLSSAEILHRQILCLCIPSQTVVESRRLVHFTVVGMVFGLVLGSAADIIPIAINSFGAAAVQSTSWLMMLLWLTQFVRLCAHFRLSSIATKDADGSVTDVAAKGSFDSNQIAPTQSADYDSDSSDSGGPGTPSSMLYRSSSDVTSDNPLTASYGAIGRKGMEFSGIPPDRPEIPQSPMVGSKTARRRLGACRSLKIFAGRVRKLLGYHLAIPISFLVHLYTSFACEVILTSTPIVTNRYFGWTGSQAGVQLSTLALLILPVTFFCERIARRYEERTVMKCCLQVAAIGLLVMINWVSLFSLVIRVPILLHDIEDDDSQQIYDYEAGVFQFVLGSAIVFLAVIGLQGANLSLLSKVAPQRIRSVVMNIGTLTTFVTLAARLAADVQILFVGLSHKLINTDIVNALAIPLLLIAFVIAHFLRRHYFFLM